MTLSLDRCLEAVANHSHGLAEAARDNLDARVEHCPGWSVADLVSHVTEVHWFWRTIAGERLDAPPDESRRPVRAPDEELVDAFLAGAEALVETLRTTDQGRRAGPGTRLSRTLRSSPGTRSRRPRSITGTPPTPRGSTSRSTRTWPRTPSRSS